MAARDVAFVKDFPSSFPRHRWDAFPFENAEHAFLIRHPREALASMYSIVALDPNSTGYEYFDSDEVGFESQLDYLEQRLQRRPTVLDHQDSCATLSCR